MTTEFIRHAGDSLASIRILDGTSPLGWAFREAPVAPGDNGWRFLSQDDNETFINAPGNIRVADFNAVAEIEPAVIAIYGFPVGTDLTFVIEPSGARKFLDSTTREEVALPYLPVTDLGTIARTAAGIFGGTPRVAKFSDESEERPVEITFFEANDADALIDVFEANEIDLYDLGRASAL